MKGYSKPALLMVSTGLWLHSPLLLAQMGNNPSQKASDIQQTSPATVSEQDSGRPYSQQKLCQVGNKLSNTTRTGKQNSLGAGTVTFDSPGERKIRKGFPISKVLGSIGKESNPKQSKSIKTEPRSIDCE